MCDKHRVKWCVGSGLFSSFHHETPEERFKSRDMLAQLREVEPYYHPRQLAERRGARGEGRT